MTTTSTTSAMHEHGVPTEPTDRDRLYLDLFTTDGEWANTFPRLDDIRDAIARLTAMVER